MSFSLKIESIKEESLPARMLFNSGKSSTVNAISNKILNNLLKYLDVKVSITNLVIELNYNVQIA